MTKPMSEADAWSIYWNATRPTYVSVETNEPISFNDGNDSDDSYQSNETHSCGIDGDEIEEQMLAATPLGRSLLREREQKKGTNQTNTQRTTEIDQELSYTPMGRAILRERNKSK